MNLPTFIKEKRAEFDPRCRMMDGFLYYREEDAITFLETCLTQLVEKIEEETVVDRCCHDCFGPSHDALVGPDYMVSQAMPEGCKDEECPCHERTAETRRRFHLFKTGEEHTGV